MLNGNWGYYRKQIGYTDVSVNGHYASFKIDYSSVMQGLMVVTGQCAASASSTYFTMIYCVNSEWNDMKLLYNEATNGDCTFDSSSHTVTIHSTSGIMTSTTPFNTVRIVVYR